MLDLRTFVLKGFAWHNHTKEGGMDGWRGQEGGPAEIHFRETFVGCIHASPMYPSKPAWGKYQKPLSILSEDSHSVTQDLFPLQWAYIELIVSLAECA